MSGSRTRIAFAAINFMLVAGLQAATRDPSGQDQSYRSIVDRNPFNLKPPPTNPPPVVVPQPPKSEIKLTGITSFGALKAYFMATDKQANKTEYYTLGVDEKRDGMEVVEIDAVNRNVKVRTSGIETVMNFATHGVTPAAIAVTPTPHLGAPGAPGAFPFSGAIPGAPPAGTITTAYTAGGGANANTLGGGRTIPSRVVRSGLQAGGIADPNLAARYGLTPAPNQPVVNQNVFTPAVPDRKMSTEEQVLMLELQKAAEPHIKFPPTPIPALPGMQR